MPDLPEIQFDWDQENVGHLGLHEVSRQEFEQVLINDPVDLEYQIEASEERFKSVGVTDSGRVLVVVWTIRRGKVRAVTAYPGSKRDEIRFRNFRR